VTRIEAIEKLEMFLSAMISEFGTSDVRSKAGATSSSRRCARSM
jgi:hypothetical protein